MTDYDEIRTCCTDKKICKRCWGFIAAAVKVLDNALRGELRILVSMVLTAETFGFKHLMWVYSGRRGIHCWVSDTLAVDLTDDQRRALVTFLEVIKGSKEQAKKVNVRGGRDDTPLHPYLADALETLKYEFTKLCLLDQDVFKTERGWEALLALVPSDRGELYGTRIQLTADKTEKLRGLWESEPDRPSEQKWKDVMDIVHTYKRAKNPMGRKWDAALEDLILQYTYPRIDAEVSKHRNHLLKAPFCVHPGTGRVCVPVDPAKVELFDPDAVPTVGELLVELDRAPPSDSEGKGEPSTRRKIAHTRLRPDISQALCRNARPACAGRHGGRQADTRG